MDISDRKRVQFICENCGFDCGLVQPGFSEKCPLCGSSLSYDGTISGCFRPESPMWVPVAAWVLLIGGISNALFQTYLADYGIFAVLLSIPFFIWHKKNRNAESHAIKLREQRKIQEPQAGQNPRV